MLATTFYYYAQRVALMLHDSLANQGVID